MNRKHIGTTVRWTLAAAGIAFIAFTFVWTDHIQLPGGYTALTPSGESLHISDAVKLRIKQRSDDLLHIGPWLDADGREHMLTLRATDLGQTEDGHAELVPGVVTTLRKANWTLLGLGLLLMGVIFPLQGSRWYMLMHCRGMPVQWRQAFRLTMVGQFFNICMPGSTGGDVMKAYYAAKGAERRADAVMSVVFDRLTGMIGLVLLAALIGLASLENQLARAVTATLWCVIAALLIGAACYFSTRLRRWLHIETLIRKLPGQSLFQTLDGAAVAYGNHRVAVVSAVGISLVVHLCLSTATATAGYALGIEHPLLLMLTVLPVTFLAASVPITPQGIGIMEGAGVAMLVAPGVADDNQVLGMMLMLRGFHVFYALLGSITLLKGDIHLHPQDAAETSDAEDANLSALS